MFDLQATRDAIPALAALAYLNTGTAGPMPAVVAEAMRTAITEDEIRGRISGKRFQKIDELFAATRKQFASMLAVDADQVALTSGTVDGIEIALAALDLQPGQGVLTTSLEHPAAREALERLAKDRGVTITIIDIALAVDDATLLAQIDQRLLAHTRVLLISHVAYGTGRLLPIADIGALARDRNVTMIVDGAQAAGACLVLPGAADFYALPGQKWLMGPEGAGALVVAAGLLPRLCNGRMRAARELERGTKAKPIWAGMAAALHWRSTQGSEEELAARIAANRELLAAKLSSIGGVTRITPDGAAGILSIAVDGHTPATLLPALAAARLAVRDVPGTPWIRISCGFFTSEHELDAVAETIARSATKDSKS